MTYCMRYNRFWWLHRPLVVPQQNSWDRASRGTPAAECNLIDVDTYRKLDESSRGKSHLVSRVPRTYTKYSILIIGSYTGFILLPRCLTKIK